jgi:inositol oxygenase
MTMVDVGADEHSFRRYSNEEGDRVREFYKTNHARQTLDFVLQKKAEYLPLRHARMTVWDALHELDRLVDESDPDTSSSQIDHALQTAEAVRAAGHPDWFVVTGLVHDLGKMLCFFGEPQWAVVGDTFPVGCAFSEKVVYPGLFAENPDSGVPEYQTQCGIYEPGCGFDRLHLSWGHDEYLYQVLRGHLPGEALAMIRYHSFYAAHRGGAYAHLMNDRDRALLPWVERFNPFDLYSKKSEAPDRVRLLADYETLVRKCFPTPLDW